MSERRLAGLVWDGGDDICFPPEMGTPRADQLQGTVGEKLCETCGRICYDSAGTGRSSDGYHAHIREVNHYSTVEPFHATVEFMFTGGFQRPAFEDALMAASYFLNRPGVYVRRRHGQSETEEPFAVEILRVTLNPRVVLDWGKHDRSDDPGTAPRRALRYLLHRALAHLAPRVMQPSPEAGDFGMGVSEALTALNLSGEPLIVEPETDDEKHVSLYLRGSRGFSHELVRHRFSMSQRSTRYCDESESPWVEHPLVTQYFSETLGAGNDSEDLSVERAIESGRRAYDHLVRGLQGWLERKGVDKLSARKQARGAARGYLGNALETELIFTASIAGWRHMLALRASDAADAEIRAVFCEALGELKRSRYGDRFQDMELGPAKDGIGTALKNGGAR